MASQAYYNPVATKESNNEKEPSVLKPMLLTQLHSEGSQQYAGYDHSQGLHSPPMNDEYDLETLQQIKSEDEKLKRQIRILRIIARALALLLSILVFVPITMTLAKFLSTNSIFRPAPGPDGHTAVNRTAWARNSKTWPTYMYFAIAAVSLVLNVTIMIAYLRNIRSANIASLVASVFSWLVLATNAIVWIIGVTLYRTERGRNGATDDLWAWTCSRAAQNIQGIFNNEVDFDRYCDVQSFSWYAGIVQVGVALLTIVIYVYAFRRRKAKKTVKRMSTNVVEKI